MESDEEISAEDLNDLEEQLYGQVHHEVNLESDSHPIVTSTENNIVTVTGLLNAGSCLSIATKINRQTVEQDGDASIESIQQQDITETIITIDTTDANSEETKTSANEATVFQATSSSADYIPSKNCKKNKRGRKENSPNSSSSYKKHQKRSKEKRKEKKIVQQQAKQPQSSFSHEDEIKIQNDTPNTSSNKEQTPSKSPSVITTVKQTSKSPGVINTVKQTPKSPGVINAVKQTPKSPGVINAVKKTPKSPGVINTVQQSPQPATVIVSNQHTEPPAAIIQLPIENKKKNKKETLFSGKVGFNEQSSSSTPKKKQLKKKVKKLNTTQNNAFGAKILKQEKEGNRKCIPKPDEIISLDSSSSESENDVIILPSPTVCIYTINDSDEDKKSVQDDTTADAGENSIMHTPQLAEDAGAQHLDTSSRCTTPSSIVSSIGFLAESDRKALLKRNLLAADEDLFVTNENVDSLMEPPRIQMTDKKRKPNEATETVSKDMNKYRVEHPHFRAMDVYESDSESSESVYSKGNPKSTIIREIKSTSEGEENNSVEVTAAQKQYRKRRPSNKDRAPNGNDNTSSNEEDNGGVRFSGVQNTYVGSGVEQNKFKRRKRDISFGSRNAMSEKEFIETLNIMAQGGKKNDDDGDSTDSEILPTARELAEKAVMRYNEHSRQKKSEKKKKRAANKVSLTEKDNADNRAQFVPPPQTDLPHTSSALPDTAIANLNQVFQVIEKLSVPKKKANLKSNSDSDVEIINTSLTHQPTERRTEEHPSYFLASLDNDNIVGGIGWNNEMRRFYNNSWNGEYFRLKDVWRQMDPNKNLWKINEEDKFPNRRRRNKVKCFNCCEYGHTRAQCQMPRKDPICHMCAGYGHRALRCPVSCCLRCGNKTESYVNPCNSCTFQNDATCMLCMIRGHTLENCPDKWRRYHSTTKPNTVPKCDFIYNSRKFCCSCGKEGHLYENCKVPIRSREYPIALSMVKSHHKAYDDQLIDPIQTNILCNVLSDPNIPPQLKLAENTTASKCYGRFLEAVGLGYKIQQKSQMSISLSGTPVKKLKRLSNTPKSTARKRKANQVQKVSEVIIEENVIDDVDDNQVETVSNFSDAHESTSCQVNMHAIKTESAVNNSTELLAHCELSNTERPPDEIALSNATVDGAQSEPNHSNKSNTTPIESQSMEKEVSGNMEKTTSNGQTPETQIQLQLVTNKNNAPSTLASQNSISKKQESRKFENIPEYIPLVDGKGDGRSNGRNPLANVGISHKYSCAQYMDNKPNPKSTFPSERCEAKIYLKDADVKYLVNVEGLDFLKVKSQLNDIKVRLDKTSVGHVLVVYGLPLNQDRFRDELVQKLDQVAKENQSRKLVEESQQVPKRSDVLIRFLRDSINQLFKPLGNAKHLFDQLKMHEAQNSKNGWKSAEKDKRLLNMILIGQAGILNGDRHLEELLQSLKTLTTDYKADQVIGKDMRQKIDAHWKPIFSSYRHDDYIGILETYRKLTEKNRLPGLKIDPTLLMQNKLDTSFTQEQKNRIEKEKLKVSAANTKPVLNLVPNPCNLQNYKLLNKKRGGTTPAMRSGGGNNTTPFKNHSTPPPPPPPFINPEQISMAATKVNKNSQYLENTCDNILKGICRSSSENVKYLRNCQTPSMFWSREAIKFLVDCAELAEANVRLMRKLQNVQEKCRSGLMSYNDYRAVLKLHNAMTQD